MSIRPVDMQIMVQKTPDAGKTNNIENQRPQIQQEHMVERHTREVLLNEERVTKSEQTQGQGVNEDGKGGAAYERRSKKNKREREKAREKTVEKSGFDISI